MRTALALALGLALAALIVPAFAISASTPNSDAIALLQRRVTNLERTANYLKTQMSLQIKINGAQARINDTQQHINTATNDRLSTVELKEATSPSVNVTWSTGVPGIVSPHSWNSTLFASCLTGTRIGGGYSATYPVMVGNSYPFGLSIWNIAAYNPYDTQALVTPYAVCLNIG
jgi:hypothetical protein